MDKKLIEKKLDYIEKHFLLSIKELREMLLNKPEVIEFKQLNSKQKAFLQVLKDNKEKPLTLTQHQNRLGGKSNNLVLHYFKMLHKRGYINYRSVKDYDVNVISINNVAYLS